MGVASPASTHTGSTKSLEGTKTESFSDFISLQEELLVSSGSDRKSPSPTADGNPMVIVKETTGSESIDHMEDCLQLTLSLFVALTSCRPS